MVTRRNSQDRTRPSKFTKKDNKERACRRYSANSCPMQTDTFPFPLLTTNFFNFLQTSFNWVIVDKPN